MGTKKTFESTVHRHSFFILFSSVSLNFLRPAIHLSLNTRKQLCNAKNKKGAAGYFKSLFSHFAPLFSLFAFCAWVSIPAKSQRILWFIFCGINKTRNLHEIRKVYNECFVFRGVFCENIGKIPAKYEIQKV